MAIFHRTPRTAVARSRNGTACVTVRKVSGLEGVGVISPKCPSPDGGGSVEGRLVERDSVPADGEIDGSSPQHTRVHVILDVDEAINSISSSTLDFGGRRRLGNQPLLPVHNATSHQPPR